MSVTGIESIHLIARSNCAFLPPSNLLFERQILTAAFPPSPRFRFPSSLRLAHIFSFRSPQAPSSTTSPTSTFNTPYMSATASPSDPATLAARPSFAASGKATTTSSLVSARSALAGFTRRTFASSGSRWRRGSGFWRSRRR